MQTPIVSEADRQRGWAELEIEFTDGKREFVRVHALDQSDLTSLAAHAPEDAITTALEKSLRSNREFVARIAPDYQIALTAMLASLIFGDAGVFSLIQLFSAKDTIPLTPAALEALTPNATAAVLEARKVAQRAAALAH